MSFALGRAAFRLNANPVDVEVVMKLVFVRIESIK